ncbi:MAG: endonuclease/exonuclease/phosphatase family protein [Phycisphaeraceae bacterium]
MRCIHRLLLAVLLVMVPLALAPLPGSAAPQDNQRVGPSTLVVLTYNIRHGQGTDGQVDLKRIAEVIEASGAHVVALQEVDNETARTDGVDQARVLAELLHMDHHAFGPAIDFQGGQYGNAILSRYRIDETENIRLPQVNAGEARAALTARIRLPDDRTFTLVATHLDHRDEANRLAQIDRINRRFSDDARPVILAGDMNAEPGTRELVTLTEHWERACEDDPAFTAPAEAPTVRIDYIFVRPADRWEVRDATVIEEPLASDHRPLRVTLQLRN